MDIIKTQKGYVSLLAGKTNMGKSTISCYDCAENIRKGKKVMFFSYEYCQSIIYNKLVTHFNLGFQELFGLNVVDARGISFTTLKEMLVKNKDTVDMVYIDYCDLLVKASYNEKDNLTDEQKLINKQHILSELASLAYELKISIVILARLRTSYTLTDTMAFLEKITSAVRTPAPTINMFIAQGETLNPMIKSQDISSVIVVEGKELSHFSSINLKQAYQD